MGERGKLRIPAQLRLVGDQTPATAADIVAPSRPDMPAEVAAEPALAALWTSICDELDAAGLLAGCDALTLELGLRHFLAARKAAQELLGNSTVALYDPEHDRMQKDPTDAVFRMQSELFLKYAAQLGMSFAARSRIDVRKGASGPNPFAP